MFKKQGTALTAQSQSEKGIGHRRRINHKVLWLRGDVEWWGSDWVIVGEQVFKRQEKNFKDGASGDDKEIPGVLYPKLIKEADRLINRQDNKPSKGQEQRRCKLLDPVRDRDEHQENNPEPEQHELTEQTQRIQPVQVLQH